MARPIRTLLVDDHAIVRAGIRALLAGVGDIELVGEAANGVEAVALVAQVAPEVVVLDLEMPGGDGTSAIEALTALPDAPHLLVLSFHTEEERLLATVRAGAGGYLCKTVMQAELAEAIRVVATGDRYLRPGTSRALAEALQSQLLAPPESRRSAYDQLSPRERDVVRLLATGFNGPEVGGQLGISAKTVDTYKQRIGEKLGLRHRTDYVRFGLRLGLLRDG